jgi:myo-inositol-1(or 4)-monophosphatase
VIDHSQNDYFWSIGDNEVYINDQLLQSQNSNEKFGAVIDIDFRALGFVSDERVKKHIKATTTLLLETDYQLQSLNTSLGFAYTAIGKIDGFINPDNHPWDICAASFLIQQAGGIITQLDGSPWNVASVGAIGAKNTTIHNTLLDAYLAAQ